MPELGLGRNFVSGFSAGSNLATTLRQQEIDQQQAAVDQRNKFLEQVNKNFKDAVTEAVNARKNALVTKNPEAIAASNKQIDMFTKHFTRMGQRMQEQGLPVNPAQYQSVLQSVKNMPTPEQSAKVEANAKFQVSAAEEQGTRSVQPLMRVVSGDTQLGRSLGIPEDEMARVEVPKDGSEPRVVARFGAPNEINISQGDSAFDKGLGKAQAERIDRMITAGQQAVVTEQKGRQLANLLKSGVSTGTLQPAFTFIQGIAADLGVDISEAAQDVGIESLSSLDKKEEFDRLSKQIIIAGFNDFKGNLNKKEVEIAMDAYQNLGRSEEANIEAVAALLASQQIARKRGLQANNVSSQMDARILLREVMGDDVEEFKRLKELYAEEIRESRGQQPEPEMEVDEETQELLDKYLGDSNGNP